jgi:hypothetical protein
VVCELLVTMAICLLLAQPGSAQSIISGEITGTVTDSTHAVVPNATVNLLSTETGFSASVTTSSSGTFRFPLLRPGTYSLSVTANNFRVSKRSVDAAVGAVTEVPIQLEIGATTETVEVVATAPVLDTENANLTTVYTPAQIENIPNPGGDLTNYALSAPGVIPSTGAGYGNFSANGLGGTSNLYTINGGDMNDPYNNLNNSGSSNNMLGANEIQEVAMVTNGYTGQYGRAASVNMNFTTKSGTNSFHGNAKWDWTGRTLIAEDWFSNATGTPKPFSNSNEWGGSFGGPIIKNKLYFFYDNEGLRYVLPGGGGPVYIPTADFATAVQARIDATQPAESAFYQQMFPLYAGAPGASRATPLSTSGTDTGGCGKFARTLDGFTFGPGGEACTKTFRSTTVNLNRERLQSIRVDYELSAKDHLSARYWQDRGVQPTYTDPINAAFNEQSVQPQDSGQLSETHTFSPSLVNQVIIGGFYYSAIFGTTAGASVFPTTIGISKAVNSCSIQDGNLSCIGGELYRFPQGRNVGQAQLVDDVSWTRGVHTFKFGVNYRKINFADYGPAANHTGDVRINDMNDFVDGVLTTSQLRQQFSLGQDFQISNYSVGFYAQDEWAVKSNLKITASLRLDRNSNESCKTDCFVLPHGDFVNGISHDVTTPYNQSILAGQHSIFPNLQRVVWEPRGGFAWTPGGSNGNTVIRGGAGIFSDLYPAQISTNLLSNPPNTAIWSVGNSSGSRIPFAPGVTVGAFADTAASNTAFSSGYASGETFGTISAAVTAASKGTATFHGPNFYYTTQNMENPRYAEWNLEVEHSFNRKFGASLNYVGNHGSNEIVLINGINAYATSGTFGNLPSSAPDPRFGVVTALTNGGYSNYNGLTGSVTVKGLRGLTTSLNYTYSHSLDTMSNGGIDQYSTNQTGDSLRFQVDPKNLRLNYGNSDYDFRHVVSLNYVWEVPYLSSNRWLGGWTISGVLFRRSGEPYSVVDSGLLGSVGNYNTTGATIMADYLGGATPGCTVSHTDQINSPFNCLTVGQFAASSAQTDFGNIGRNQFRGPGYFDTDLSIKKSFRVTNNENGLRLIIGANAYNILNHANFGNPDSDVADGPGVFGTIQNTVTPASSPFGNFQGSAVSGRILQLEMQLKF